MTCDNKWLDETMALSWNKETCRYEPFTPGARKYPPLSPELYAELKTVRPTNDGMMKYYPCLVTLKDGKKQDFVYIVDANDYIRVWGVWPDQDAGKSAIRIEDVRTVEESPSRLPTGLAQLLYDAGESGMGYVLFEVSYADGSRSAHVSGNAVDFIRLPDGRTPSDILGVHPHAGREVSDRFTAPEYYWCLFEGSEKKRGKGIRSVVLNAIRSVSRLLPKWSIR